MMRQAPTPKRNRAILEEYERGGITFKALGAKYGITGSRVRDIVEKVKRIEKHHARIAGGIDVPTKLEKAKMYRILAHLFPGRVSLCECGADLALVQPDEWCCKRTQMERAELFMRQGDLGGTRTIIDSKPIRRLSLSFGKTERET